MNQTELVLLLMRQVSKTKASKFNKKSLGYLVEKLGQIENKDVITILINICAKFNITKDLILLDIGHKSILQKLMDDKVNQRNVIKLMTYVTKDLSEEDLYEF